MTGTATATSASPDKSKTMAIHVRFESLYISLPSSTKQQREMTKFYVLWRTRTAIANFLLSSFRIERCWCMFSPSKFLDRQAQ